MERIRETLKLSPLFITLSEEEIKELEQKLLELLGYTTLEKEETEQ